MHRVLHSSITNAGLGLNPVTSVQGNLTQLVMAAEGATPSRMNREGAARTYSLYQCASHLQMCQLKMTGPTCQKFGVGKRNPHVDNDRVC